MILNRLPSVVGCASRSISSSFVAQNRYDPRLFRDPVTDIKEMHQPLDENDERNFLYLKAMKSDDTPVFYRDHTVDKLTRVIMNSGRKETARHHVYAALEIIKRRQYKAWLKAETEEEKSKIELDPFVIARKAIENCHPLMKLQGVTRGGTTYQVPFPIEKAEAEFRAMKMMRDICRQKAAHGETHLKDILAAELLAASQNEGLTIQAKQELHKTCEANRAYAHYSNVYMKMSLAGMAAKTLAEFEQQYSVQTAEVTTTIARLPSLPASERPASVQSVQKILTEVSELLEQMELAVRDLASGSAERNKYELRVRSYRNDKRLLDGELEKAIKRLRESADREELLAYDEAVEMDQQEEQLIANTERLERSSRKIQDAYRMAVETEQIGSEVLGNLSSQRETIGRARDRMREANVELGRSNRLLNTMIRRVIQNRLLLLVVAVLLMFCLLFIIYKTI